MAATVRLDIFQGIEATIDGYKWSSDNKKIAEVLNNLLDPEGPPTYDPNPDLTEARKIVKRLGGKVLRYDESAFDPKVIY